MRDRARTFHRPNRRTTRVLALGVAATLATGVLAGCGSDDEEGGGDGNVEISIGVFGQFGFEEAGLYDEYMELNPNVTITQDSITENGDYIAQLRTRLAQNSGLMDIQAIEVGNIAEMTGDLNNRWVDFNEYEDVDTSHFLPWKLDQATTEDGRVIGLGTDIGPTGICYRTDYFEEAGLPTDREEVSALFADWQSYLDVGEQFLANGPADVAYLDSAGGMFNAVVSGYEERYYSADGEVNYQESEAVQTAWDLSVQAAEGELTDRQQQFSDEWNTAFANGAFATVASCPAWMLGYIQSEAGENGQGAWDVAQSPSPSNWGGSFIGVPEASDNKEEAVKLAAWLTAPEQQAKLFTERGSFPSSAAAHELPEVLEATHEYFQDAPIGQIFTEAAAEIPSSVIGPQDQVIQQGITDGLAALEQQGISGDEAWDSVVSQLDNALAE
ncbi:ABC transporter substrate-binding protein [Streptomyces triticirhizae]|uniref:Carbohydrate ABC transporter substrate-binding protein n=1 Tax=Streptomyces triticirhizae TaxID=2483353 RepID=A0A3M2M3M9_9ACTN|nr:ABC transporter substrate-binding protein [Streptomyces triticirhizae]RMI44022.1 carbohydrate ABC transporter substrate-binding protein [Streptomyces triticirhizae]